jgi:hypothetical protein
MTRRLDEGERELPPGLLRFLATGATGSDLDVFLFWGRLLRFATGGRAAEPYRPAVDELARLWREHENEIRATAGKAEPWVLRWLREHCSEHITQR